MVIRKPHLVVNGFTSNPLRSLRHYENNIRNPSLPWDPLSLLPSHESFRHMSLNYIHLLLSHVGTFLMSLSLCTWSLILPSLFELTFRLHVKLFTSISLMNLYDMSFKHPSIYSIYIPIISK